MSTRAAGIAAAVFFLVLGAGQVYLALDLSRGSLSEPGPGLFPLLVGVFMSASALMCFLPGPAEPVPPRPDAGANGVRLFVVASAFAVFIYLLPRVGFILPSMLFQLVALRVFGMRGWWRTLLTAVVITAAATLLFEKLLAVRFPTPTWTF